MGWPSEPPTHTSRNFSNRLYKYQLGTGYTNGWAGGNGGWYNFKGQIDEVAVYQRPLTPQEIRSVYLAGSGGKASITGLTDQEDDDDHRQCDRLRRRRPMLHPHRRRHRPALRWHQ